MKPIEHLEKHGVPALRAELSEKTQERTIQGDLEYQFVLKYYFGL